jgi:hypothetical protein
MVNSLQHHICPVKVIGAAIPNSNETLTRRDFVAEAGADLCGGEGQTALIELEQALEVDEDALSRLGTEEALYVTGGTDLRGEHEIERDRVRQIVARKRRFKAELLDRRSHVILAETVQLKNEGRVIRFSLRCSNIPEQER